MSAVRARQVGRLRPIGDSPTLGTLEQRRRRAGYAALSPALLVLAVDSRLSDRRFHAPVGAGVARGRRHLRGPVHRALATIGALLADDTFRAALWATAYFTAIEVVVVVLLALGVALLLVHPYGRFWHLPHRAAAALGDRAGRQRGPVEMDPSRQLRHPQYAVDGARPHRTQRDLAGHARSGAAHRAGGRRLEVGAVHRHPAPGRTQQGAAAFSIARRASTAPMPGSSSCTSRCRSCSRRLRSP